MKPLICSPFSMGISCLDQSSLMIDASSVVIRSTQLSKQPLPGVATTPTTPQTPLRNASPLMKVTIGRGRALLENHA